jgi:hypothetical protein
LQQELEAFRSSDSDQKAEISRLTKENQRLPGWVAALSRDFSALEEQFRALAAAREQRRAKDIADYEEVRELGKGTFVVVHLCRERSTGATVVVQKMRDWTDARNRLHFVHSVLVPLRLNLLRVVKVLGFQPPSLNDSRPGAVVSEFNRNGDLESAFWR